MRTLLALLLILLPACYRVDHVYHLRADGSGRVDVSIAWNGALLLESGGLLGSDQTSESDLGPALQRALLGVERHPLLPFSLDAFLAACEGVTGLSEARLTVEDKWVRQEFSLWFDDVEKFRMPPFPSGDSGEARGSISMSLDGDESKRILTLHAPLTSFVSNDAELEQMRSQKNTPILKNGELEGWKGFRLSERYLFEGFRPLVGKEADIRVSSDNLFGTDPAPADPAGHLSKVLDRIQKLLDRRGSKIDFVAEIDFPFSMEWEREFEQARETLARRQGPWLRFVGHQGPGVGKEIVLVSGDEEYRSEEALPMLARILAVRHGFSCTVLFSQDPQSGLVDPENRTFIPGLDQLDHADLLVLFTRFRTPDDAAMEALKKYVDSGRPVIGLRTATHAFLFPKESKWHGWSWNAADPPGGFGRAVLGETWVAHHGGHGRESTLGLPDPAAKDHPVLRGVESAWGPTDVYRVRELPADSTVLLRGHILTGMSPQDPPVDDDRNRPTMPVSWLREIALPGGGVRRVYSSTFASSQDFESEGLRRAFLQACMWCLGMEAQIPDQGMEAGILGTYLPTRFGFGAQQTHLKPKSLGLAVPHAK